MLNSWFLLMSRQGVILIIIRRFCQQIIPCRVAERLWAYFADEYAVRKGKIKYNFAEYVVYVEPDIAMAAKLWSNMVFLIMKLVNKISNPFILGSYNVFWSFKTRPPSEHQNINNNVHIMFWPWLDGTICYVLVFNKFLNFFHF